jgi:predicted ester cyclase
MFSSTPDERLNMEVTQTQYDKIRSSWVKHVTDEAKGDIDGLLETMTSDCMYEIVQTGEIWEGHEGAREFYKSLMKAVPDAEFELLDIVVGPQGVFGAANMTGTQKFPFAGNDQCGQKILWRLINLFSWDPKQEKFTGERLYSLKPVAGESK